LAQTDSKSNLEFQQEIRSFHAELKHFFYTFVFQNKTFSLSDFEKIPAYERSQETQPKSADLPLLFLGISTLIVWAIGWFTIKK
jgi:ABC-2 type transport system permease protein